MVEIEVLGSGDLHILTKVAQDVFDDPILQSAAREFLNDPRHRLVVAIDDDLVVGFVSSVIYVHPDKPAPEMWINEVGVATTHQGLGIGKQLMLRTLEEARSAGCTEAWVATDKSNTAANALYRSVRGMEGESTTVLYTFRL